MPHLYKQPRQNKGFGLAFLSGLGVTGLLFLLVPLTQFLQPLPEPSEGIEPLNYATPPPPPPPEDPPEAPPKEEETPPPEMETPPPMPTLEQLEVSLNPGTGGNLQISAGFEVNFETESAAKMIDLFGFDELDAIPRVVRRARINYPPSLQRTRTEGYVQLLVIIDETGQVEVSEILSFSHREFVEPARSGAENTRFSPPLRNGQAVRARYSWKIEFTMN